MVLMPIKIIAQLFKRKTTIGLPFERKQIQVEGIVL